jgi:hypothetical protein
MPPGRSVTGAARDCGHGGWRGGVRRRAVFTPRWRGGGGGCACRRAAVRGCYCRQHGSHGCGGRDQRLRQCSWRGWVARASRGDVPDCVWGGGCVVVWVHAHDCRRAAQRARVRVAGRAALRDAARGARPRVRVRRVVRPRRAWGAHRCGGARWEQGRAARARARGRRVRCNGRQPRNRVHVRDTQLCVNRRLGGCVRVCVCVCVCVCVVACACVRGRMRAASA